ncbi:hypothetical protein [Izhakiella australiensis]|uniref:hypothetical protein n=1 Tax=Izhakiella australiensis TaxID=1926881 RepID=UPI001591AE1C|nr:hypothetical protein [Izhakiella australiensis]
MSKVTQPSEPGKPVGKNQLAGVAAVQSVTLSLSGKLNNTLPVRAVISLLP